MYGTAEMTMLLTALPNIMFMAALCNGGHYIFVLWFLPSVYLSFFFFSSPNRRLDVYHTSTHDALVRVYNACLKCAARGSLEMQDPN